MALKREATCRLLCIITLITLSAAGALADEPQSLTVFEPSATPRERIAAPGFIAAQRDGTLLLRAEGDKPAEIVITAPGGAWDFSDYQALVFSVRNASREPVTLRVRAENDGAGNSMDSCRTVAVLMPGQASDITLNLMRRPEDPGYEVFRPFMMYFKNINVRDNTMDPAAVARIVLWIDHPSSSHRVELKSIRAAGAGLSSTPPFFPFVDEYGQYIHTDWPGKVYADDNFVQRREEEARERADWAGPADWDQYGGWAKGPKLKATGFFYAAKHNGKWWLVDPDGRLFWSHGPTGVGFGGDLTPITDREHWFQSLPDRDSTWGQFYKEGHGATYRYYGDKKMDWVGYDFAAANLLRKYGEDYETVVCDLSHDRLRSWGFNTVANWSSPKIYLQRRTPYTVAIHYNSPLIHYRMPDIYHPDWEPAVRQRMQQEKDKTAGDPWNLGYFVDNERWWGWRPRAACIGEETLKNPASCAAKKTFIGQLQQKYGTIDRLNAAWSTSHASWDALLAHTDKPNLDNKATLTDCGDFGMRFAERYFSIVKDAVKSVAPDNLYLGARFHGHVDREVVALAAKYCDVISYNIYDNPPDGRVNQYRELDVPIMSTEWGVGSDQALTPFRGDKLSIDPDERTRNLTRYIEHAIRHPNMVGAHFFQYRDQPLSGRPDGEATLRGFVNITDTPNFNLIQANRRLAYDLYRTRYDAK